MKSTLLIFMIICCISCQEKPQQIVYSKSNSKAILDNFVTRRSIRQYQDKQVGKEQLDQILQSALYAPSANNKQPWEVRVVQNPQLLDEINNRFIEWAQGRTLNGRTNRYNEAGFSIFHHAPSLIVIARDKKNAYSYMDCGILLENILLSAHALNLGTCPLGAMVPAMNSDANQDILELLDIPEGYEVAVNIALGYPNEQPATPSRNSGKFKIIE